jgi:hypothetical protein
MAKLSEIFDRNEGELLQIGEYVRNNIKFSQEHKNNKILLKKSLTLGDSSFFQNNSLIDFNSPDFDT